MENGESIEAPLLEEEEDLECAPPSTRPITLQCSQNGAVANVVITAVGAGVLALPKAFSTVGIGFGVLLFLAVAFMTYFCCNTIVHHAQRTGVPSYGRLIYQEFGRKGALLLQTSVSVHVAGAMLIYLVICADMLIGNAPEYHGILPTLLDRHDGPWFLQRSFISLLLILLVITPILIPRNLAAVARFSKVTVFLITAIAASMVVLAGLAIHQGKAAADVKFWPIIQPNDTVLDVFTTYLTVISVSCLAMTCHFNLIPISLSLRDGRPKAMPQVLARGLGLCTIFYALVGLSGYVLFGSATSGDVLMNLTIKFTSQLVPELVAKILISSIGFSYVLCLCVNYVLKVWPLRENLCEIMWGCSHLDLANPWYYSLTAVLVGGSFFIASSLTEIFTVVSVVGSTACAVFSFIFPGLLVLKHRESSSKAQCIGAGFVIVLGCVMAAITVYNVCTGQEV